jgi:very-short-patch-repair endonuclease
MEKQTKIEKSRQTKIEKSRKIFFDESPKIHKSYYDYSKVEFKGVVEKVIIICPKHGEFLQSPIKHLKGQGCNKCGEERTADGQRMPQEKFIKKAKDLHKDTWNYSKVKYINWKTPVIIICKVHGEFIQKPTDHLSGSGCNDCGIIKRTNIQIQKTSQRFWEKAKQDDRFDYSKFIYKKYNVKSELTCKKCSSLFETTPNSYFNGSGCPFCKKKSEHKFYDILVKQYPLLQRQLKYDWCKNVKTNCYLLFDFCIEEYKIIIELDGIQHFQKVKHFKNTPEEQKERDLYKQKCANDNGYSVIRIYQEDVFYDTFNWLDSVSKGVEKIKNDRIIQNIYISKNDEYNDFEKIDTNNIIETVINKETYCKVCDITIFYNYKKHENTKKHKDKLMNVVPDNSKKYYCNSCNKYITDKRRHYNSENHKNKISPEEWEKQIKELDKITDKKKVQQYDLNDNLLNTFDSVNHAYRHLNSN